MPDDFDLDSYLDSQSPSKSKPNAGSPGFDLDTYLDAQSPNKAEQANPAPSAGGLSDAARKAEIAANATATGLAGALDLPGNVLGLANSLIGADQFKPRNALEAGLVKVQDVLQHPGRSINNALSIGMENRPDLAPRTNTEKYLAAGFEGLPNAALMALSGTAVAPALAISEAGSLAAEYAHDKVPDNKWLPAVAGVVASLGAGGLAGTVEKGITAWNATKALKTANANLESAESRLAAAQDAAFAGRDPRLAAGRSPESNALEIAQDAAFTGKYDAAKAANEVKKASADSLAAKRAMAEKAIQEAEADVAKQTESVAETFAKPATVQSTGDTVQSVGKNWYEHTFDKKIAEAKEPLAPALDKKPETSLSGYESTLNSILDFAPSLRASLDELTSGLPSRLRTALRPEAGKESALAELGGIEPAASGPVTVPVADAMKLRSALGNLMKNPTLLKGTDPTHIDALYKALSSDIGNSLEKVGGREAWNEYNAKTTRLYQFAGNVLSKIVTSGKEGQESILAGKVVRNLLNTAKDDGSELAAIRAEIPEAADAIAGFAIRDGSFAGLSPEAKIALVPSEDKLKQLTTAAGLKPQAESNAANTIAAAEAEHRAIVDAAEAGLKEGNFTRLKAVRDAQKAKAQASADALQAQREAAYAASARVREANKAVKSAKQSVKAATAAKNAAEPPINPLTQAVDSAKRLASGGAGFYVSPQIMNALGLNSLGPAGQLAIAGLGMAVPSVLKAAKSIAKQPSKAMIPITGVLAGNNALSSTRPK